MHMYFLSCVPWSQFFAFIAGTEGGANDGLFKDGKYHFQWLVSYSVCDMQLFSVMSIPSSLLALQDMDSIVHFQISMLKQRPQMCEPFV